MINHNVRRRRRSCFRTSFVMPLLLSGLACYHLFRSHGLLELALISGENFEPVAQETEWTPSRPLDYPSATKSIEDERGMAETVDAVGTRDTAEDKSESPSNATPIVEEAHPPSRVTQSAPNILFVVADDLRPQLGVYGKRAWTPNLDRLASAAAPSSSSSSLGESGGARSGGGGTTFTRAYAQITVCNPSRASFLSGRRPDTTEIYGFEAGSPEGWTTLPSLFKRNGYTTFGVGKIFHWGPGPSDAWSTQVERWGRAPAVGAEQYASSLSSSSSAATDQRDQASRASGPVLKEEEEEEPPYSEFPAAPVWARGMSWETPTGHRDKVHFQAETSMPRPARQRTAAAKAKSPSSTHSYPVTGFWPDSGAFQKMKTAEQKALAATFWPVPVPGDVANKTKAATAANPVHSDVLGGEKAQRTLPFRDALFASRAIRLMQIAHAQRLPSSPPLSPEQGSEKKGGGEEEEAGSADPGPRRPWFLAVGFSLPHEPLRFPSWAFEAYEGENVHHEEAVGTGSSSSSSSGSGGGGNEVGRKASVTAGVTAEGLFRLPVAAAPHPTRPLGSPLFALGDLKERFVFYDPGAQQQRRLTVQKDYGPGRPLSSAPAFDPRLASALDPFRAAQQAQAKEAASQATRRGETLRNSYVERLVKGSDTGSSPAVVVRGDDYFGALCTERVWADYENEVADRGLPLAARRELARAYSAAVTFMDFQVGRVLSALDRLSDDAAAHTVIVFTADHGFSLGDHGGFGKRSLWEPDTRVPLIVRAAPAHQLTARRVPLRVNSFVELVDLLPTLAQLAGLDSDPLIAASLERSTTSDATTLDEPLLDGTSFAHLLLPQHSGSDSSRGNGNSSVGGSRNGSSTTKPTRWRGSKKTFATSQFPRCPVRLDRKGHRKTLLNEPWRTSGAGGFECQGRSKDWTSNHELAVMGYSIRTDEWRYTAWVRVLGYRNPGHGGGSGGGSSSNSAGSSSSGGGQRRSLLSPPSVRPEKGVGRIKGSANVGGKPPPSSPSSPSTSPWQHNRIHVNWTFPPYASELYGHGKRDDVDGNRGDSQSGDGIGFTRPLPPPLTRIALEGLLPHEERAYMELWEADELARSGGGSGLSGGAARGGGAFDLGEDVNEAPKFPAACEALFRMLRDSFEHNGAADT